MDAAWALPESPYDLLGVADDCSTADVKKAYRDMARLFHPDRNTDAKDIETRTAHFLKIKKAYETLQDPGSRKLYDGCLLARERLVRKNLYKYAVSNTPEFRDVVDAQFADAVLDPERDVAGDALVLCCESCGAPSKFRCSICDRLVCAFCQLKQHAFDGIPPHYPAKYTPRYRRQIESDGRLRRLLDHQKEVGDRPWAKSDSDRASARRRVGLLKKKSDGDDRAPLSLTYGWCQTQACVYVAVFVPGLCEDDDAVRVSLTANRLSVGPRNGQPTIDRPLAYQAMGALECVVFGSAEVALVRCQKANLGEVWRELFVEDSLLLRDAGDHDQHLWWRDASEDFREPEPSFGVDVFVPRNCTVEDLEVELTARHLMVKVAGWGVFRRHWVYTCRSDEASWHLVDDCVEINQ
jgi:curved DNA-binding protein CbpA